MKLMQLLKTSLVNLNISSVNLFLLKSTSNGSMDATVSTKLHWLNTSLDIIRPKRGSPSSEFL